MLIFMTKRRLENLIKEEVEKQTKKHTVAEPLPEETTVGGRNKRWNKADETVIHRAVKTGMKVRSVAKLLERTPDAVKTRAIQMGYKTKDYDYLIEKEV